VKTPDGKEVAVLLIDTQGAFDDSRLFFLSLSPSLPLSLSLFAISLQIKIFLLLSLSYIPLSN
jgi:hypothetical protein